MYIHEVTKEKKYKRKHWDGYMTSKCTFPDLDISDTSRYFLPTIFRNDEESLYYLTIEDVEANDWEVLEE